VLVGKDSLRFSFVATEYARQQFGYLLGIRSPKLIQAVVHDSKPDAGVSEKLEEFNSRGRTSISVRQVLSRVRHVSSRRSALISVHIGAFFFLIHLIGKGAVVRWLKCWSKLLRSS